jgi:hypothetical protein
MRSAATLSLLVLASCAVAPPARDPGDPFAVEGADLALRPDSDAERATIRAGAARLAALYGYAPDGTLRDLVLLKDLLDRADLFGRITAPPVTTLAPALRRIGYRFRPGDAEDLVRSPDRPAGGLLADPAVLDFLAGLLEEGLLHDDAARDLLALSPERADDLRRLASAPDGAGLVRAEAVALPYRFRPRDARDLLPRPRPFTGEEADFLRPLLAALRVDYRPGFRPELAAIAARPDAVGAFAALAAERAIPFSGPGGLLALARLVRDHEPPEGDARGRFESLAKRLVWPDAADLPGLLSLAADPRALPLVEGLEHRFSYRLATADARDLLALAGREIPEPARPDWAIRDRVPLEQPGLLLSEDPVEAFVPPGDLWFMERIAQVRPEAASSPKETLERTVRAIVRPLPVRYRTGAPYVEDASDLGGFTRPDLLKILLLLEELARPETVSFVAGSLAGDLADPERERGGFVLLGPDGRLAFALEPPRDGGLRDDRLFLPPAPPDAVAEFHFHATDPDDSDYAGPSAGGPGSDLFRAARRRVDGLVFTSLPGGRFDADFYSSSGFVLDLGIRPSARP